VEELMFSKFLKSSVVFGALSLAACGGVCGDGAIDAENKDGVAELCDDGNAVPNDGCNAVCGAIDAGFACDTPGQACEIILESLGCRDGIDNDADGLLDCADLVDCGTADACQELVCNDGIDDNGNGDIDCADAQCAGNDACIELQCDDNLDNDTDNLIDCADGDCIFAANCAIAGDGFLTPAVEQCDDGNEVNGDGCSSTMTMEALSDIIVPLDNDDLNKQDTELAVFSVVMPFNQQFDLDNDGVIETNLLMVVTSSRATICQDMFNPANDDGQAGNGTIGPFNTVAAFGGKIIGTTVVTFVQTSDIPLGVFNFVGVGAPPLTKIVQTNGNAGPGEIFTEVGFINLDANGNALGDTTFASDGAGVINVTKFDIVETDFVGFENAAGPIPIPVGNIELNFTNVNMVGQFIAAANQDLDGDGDDETKGISQPISGTIKATTCGATMFF
jgi:cysteine-rich repeat protein